MCGVAGSSATGEPFVCGSCWKQGKISADTKKNIGRVGLRVYGKNAYFASDIAKQ